MKQRTRIWKKNICRTTTDALPIRRRVRLSRPEADGPRTAGEFPLSDRAHDEQGLGDPHKGRSLQLQPGQRRYGPTQSKALVCEMGGRNDARCTTAGSGEPIPKGRSQTEK